MIALSEKSTDRQIGLDAEVEQIYEETRTAICAYLIYLGVSSDRAPELTQEVYLRLYQAMRKGNSIDNLRAWLFRVAHNLGLKARLRERSFRVVGNPDWDRFAHSADSAESVLLERERNSLVAAALEGLSPQQRHCLYLRSQGLRYREIGEVMGIGSSTVNEFFAASNCSFSGGCQCIRRSI